MVQIALKVWWMGGWMDGWMGGLTAVLRIAYSNLKVKCCPWRKSNQFVGTKHYPKADHWLFANLKWRKNEPTFETV